MIDDDARPTLAQKARLRVDKKTGQNIFSAADGSETIPKQ